MERIIALIIGYVFGMFSSATVVGKLRGVNIRDYGSGNPGMSNVSRTLGFQWGILVLILDMLKSFIPIMLCSVFIAKTPEMGYLVKAYAFAGVVLGHDYPINMEFRGGKGVAVLTGFILAFHWSLIPIALLAFFIPYLLTHYVSLGSMCLYCFTAVGVIALGAAGVFGGIPVSYQIEIDIIISILAILCVVKHHGNISRLIHHNERRTYLFRRTPEEKTADTESDKTPDTQAAEPAGASAVNKPVEQAAHTAVKETAADK